MALDNVKRENDLDVKYHKLMLRVYEFSTRERIEWIKIYAETEEVPKLLAKIDKDLKAQTRELKHKMELFKKVIFRKTNQLHFTFMTRKTFVFYLFRLKRRSWSMEKNVLCSSH